MPIPIKTAGEMMEKNMQTHMEIISEIDEMIDGDRKLANDELRPIYPKGTSRGYSNTLKSWSKHARSGNFHYFGHLTAFRNRLEHRLKIALEKYEKMSGKTAMTKSIKEVEKKTKEIEEEHFRYGKIIRRIVPEGVKLPIIFPTNRASYSRVDLSLEEMDELFNQYLPIHANLIEEIEFLTSEKFSELIKRKDYRDLIPEYCRRNKVRITKVITLQKRIRMLQRSRLSELMLDGIPQHVAEIMAFSNIKDEEGIILLRELRGGNIVDRPRNYESVIEIEKMVLSGRIALDDGLLLVENSDHGVLVSAIHDGEIKMEFARDLLTKLSFSSHPEATAKIVGGGDLRRVALLYGIVTEPTTEPEEDDPEKQDEDEEHSVAPARGRSRFAD